MNYHELEILNRAINDMGDTFKTNRALKEHKRERAEDLGLKREEMGMRREEFGLRRDDAADARDIRRQGMTQTGEHQAKMQEYQKSMLEAQKEQNASLRDERMFKIFADMGKEGMLTDEAIDKMSEAFNQKFGDAGLGVKVFRLPSATQKEPKPYTHPTTGKNFLTYGNTILPADEPFAEVTEEPDPVTGDIKRKTTRKVRPTDLNAEIDKINGNKAGTERVPVVSPSGKRGTIPRSQLQDALSKGFKQAQ